MGVRGTAKQFGGDIMRCAQESALVVAPHHAGKPEIHQFGIVVPIQHDVSRFDVAVRQALAIQGRQPFGHIQCHAQRLTFVDVPLTLQLRVEILSGHEFHHEVRLLV